jgi:hypothetical protein
VYEKAVRTEFGAASSVRVSFTTCPQSITRMARMPTSLIGGDKKSFNELHDRLAYAIFPFAAYGLLVLGGVLLLHDSQCGLTLVAVGMLSLLAVAIRNSWAIAIDGRLHTPESLRRGLRPVWAASKCERSSDLA